MASRCNTDDSDRYRGARIKALGTVACVQEEGFAGLYLMQLIPQSLDLGGGQTVTKVCRAGSFHLGWSDKGWQCL
jgi:hypothetical protein